MMNRLFTIPRRSGLPLALAAGLTIAPLFGAVTYRGVQFGGFASQGYLDSSANDLFGDTSDGTFDFREYGANASWARGAWRVGAQVFGQRLGHYGDDKLKLDWATINYQPVQAFGVRAGRVKMPRGLYNEALDLDALRPFVLLPQSVYDARLRDFHASFDGGMAFGNLSIGRAGSLDYTAFYGDIPIKADSGANDYFNNDVAMTNRGIDMEAVVGGTLFWNTPVTGLRVGYSFNQFQDLASERLIPAGLLFPGSPEAPGFKSTPRYDRHLVSVEFIWNDWTLAAEGGEEQAHYAAGSAIFPAPLHIDGANTSYYVSAARRLGPKWEVGAYFSSYRERMEVWGDGFADARVDSPQDDYAVSVRYDVNDYILLKAEFHYLDGAGKVFDTLEFPQPQATRDTSWTLLAAKTSILF